MKSPIMFLQEVLKDLGTECRTSTSLDLKTIEARFENEGMSFLTISLANFGKDLEKALDQGFVAHDQFAGFQRAGGLPRLFGGFLELIFERGTGRLLDNPSIPSIHALRQITLMWAKINLPCSDVRVKRAIDEYIECERIVRENDASATLEQYRAFSRISSLLWASVFSGMDQRIWSIPSRIIPKHGPGSTQDRLKGNRKWVQTEWTERLEYVFPHQEHLISSWRSLSELPDVRILEPGTERPVRVITVPKTLKTPRIIAIEPTCMQFMQQGLLAAFREEVDADDSARQLIGWGSQVPNNHLAWKGSRDGTLSTLDLSEASDRVSNQLVRVMFAPHRPLAEAIDATRSRKAAVPGHRVIRLAKFASMGSAVCFPVEAMVFCTIIFVGIENKLNRPLTKKDIKSFLGSVRVFGDDIIVPTDYVPSVISSLEDFGLKVNRSKSFWNGKFRESCGKEYYDGEDVSIVRVRSEFPCSLTDVPEIVSTVALRNNLYKSGLWNSARYLDAVLEKIIPFPRVSEQSPVLGRHSFLGPEMDQKQCKNRHTPLVKGYVIQARPPKSKLEGYGALLKCLTMLEMKISNIPSDFLPIVGVEHLERTGRPLAVGIKLGWYPSV